LSVFSPAGGLYSNVLDMTHWVRMQLADGFFEQRRILSEESIRTLRAPRTLVSSGEAGDVAGYATGWLYQVRSPYPLIWHNGSTMGMHSVVALIPGADLGLVVLTNSYGNTLPELMMLKLYDLTFGATPAKAYLPQLGSPAGRSRIERLQPAGAALRGAAELEGTALDLNSYCGRYVNPAYGPIRVFQRNAGLVAVMGPKGIEAQLARVTGHTFTMTWPSLPMLESEVTFDLVAGSGGARRMMVEAFGDVRGGVFVRSGR
ncbi:MAG: DUF3471 domain-containing protein, partial [Alphaproteobacteria bacterium]